MKDPRGADFGPAVVGLAALLGFQPRNDMEPRQANPSLETRVRWASLWPLHSEHSRELLVRMHLITCSACGWLEMCRCNGGAIKQTAKP